jgi:protein-L-isoaspartate(D-aspartate) O-methyltransferase
MFELGRVLLICAIIMILNGCGKTHAPQAEYELQRQRMVDTQIVARGIRDVRVISAMRKVPRHLFIPESFRQDPYGDHPCPIGEGQTISQPYIVALMTEAIDVGPNEKVLEIGTGSGYQAAILAEICKEVYTIEIIEKLARVAGEVLERLGYTNVEIRVGDGYIGWEENGPYDGIIVTCAPDHVPQPLVDQLAEGGRMVIPVADTSPQRLVLLDKKAGEVTMSYITGCMFVPMVRQGTSTSK